MASKHPLDDAFNMTPDENIQEILGIDIKIPDDTNLRSIVELSLQQYKHLIEESLLLEPDQRLRHVELAKEYLRMAKDAMRDDADLEIKFHKAYNPANKLPYPPKAAETGEKSRVDVYEEIKRLKSVK